MRLTRLILRNVGRFDEFAIEFDELTVLVGPNDSGKSTVLACISALLDKKFPPKFKYFRDGSVEAQIEGHFSNDLMVRLRGDAQRYEFEEFREDYELEEVRSLHKKSKSELEELARKMGVEVDGTKDEISQVIRDTAKRTQIWSKLQIDTLPRAWQISPAEPLNILSQILKGKVEGLLRPNNELRADLSKIEADARQVVEEGIQEFIAEAQVHLPDLETMVPTLNIEVQKMLTISDLMLHRAGEVTSLSCTGSGTRHRLGLAAAVWERASNSGSRIRLYDEPETSLHYEAQRALLGAIKVVSPEDQCVIATHSPLFVDTLPLNKLRVFSGSETASRPLSWQNFGDAIGLRNTSFLFEKRFLLVEGQTEFHFFRQIYRSILGRSLEDEGVVIIDLRTCGAWKNVCNALLSWRVEDVRLVLDRDTLFDGSSAQITPATICNTELFPTSEAAQDFLQKQVAFLGKKEFEDMFPSQDWLDMLESNFDFVTPLEVHQIEERKASDKFSDQLRLLVVHSVEPHHRSGVTKPELGRLLGEWYSNYPHRCPHVLRALCEWVSPHANGAYPASFAHDSTPVESDEPDELVAQLDIFTSFQT